MDGMIACARRIVAVANVAMRSDERSDVLTCLTQAPGSGTIVRVHALNKE